MLALIFPISCPNMTSQIQWNILKIHFQIVPCLDLVHEEHDLIKSLKNQKPSQLACDYICEAITDLYNQSIAQGIVPDILKISKVTPIDKGGDTMDPTNYLHISTLSVFTQIFEKLVYKQLINYIETYDILSQLGSGKDVQQRKL